MDQIYIEIRSRAREIARSLPLPDFYSIHMEAVEESASAFETDAMVQDIDQVVAAHLQDNFGHGLAHVRAVARDAGVIVLIENRFTRYSDPVLSRRLQMVHAAGLLHDIARKEKNHAIVGADMARQLLSGFSFLPDEAEEICQAIRNHEAFREMVGVFTPEGVLLSNALYDADKFRWGPDNFKHMVWDMLQVANIPLPTFMSHYHRGLQAMERIRSTFRSRTGKEFGPQFIDHGLWIGERLYEVIQAEYSRFL